MVEKELEGECMQKPDQGVKMEVSSMKRTVVVDVGAEEENISEDKTDAVSPITHSPTPSKACLAPSGVGPARD